MRTRTCLFVPTILSLSATMAQQPGAGEAAPAAVFLQSLQLLTTESVYTRQPTSGDGSAADLAFAAIRDASFAPDGRLLEFVLEPPLGTPAGDAKRRLLPAKSVRWHAESKRWLLFEPALRWAELAEVTPDKATPADKEPVTSERPQARLATELLGAVPMAAPPDTARKALEASAQQPGALRLVWWFGPAQQQLAAAVVPHDGKHLVVPWAALRTHRGGEALSVRIDAPAAKLGEAPLSPTPDAAPDTALRQRSYQHFQTPVPAWDRPPTDTPDKDKAKDKGRPDGQCGPAKAGPR